MYVWSFQEAQRVASETDHVPVALADHATLAGEIETVQVQRGGYFAHNKPRMRGLRHKTLHAAAFVAFKVQEDDVSKTTWVEHLPDGLANVTVHGRHPCVNQRRLLVVNQELVEAYRRILGHSRDAINSANDLVNAGHLASSFTEN